MKKILAMFLSAFVLGCSEKKDEVFTLEEANMCLLESDKHAVMDAVELIKKAESEEDVSWLIRPRSCAGICCPRSANNNLMGAKVAGEAADSV